MEGEAAAEQIGLIDCPQREEACEGITADNSASASGHR